MCDMGCLYERYSGNDCRCTLQSGITCPAEIEETDQDEERLNREDCDNDQRLKESKEND